MKKFFACVLLVLSSSVAWADEADDVLEKAIKAQAKDPAALKKLTTHVCLGKGQGRLGEQLVEVQMLRHNQWPGAFRIGFSFGKEPNRSVINMVVQDDRGWQMRNDAVAELSADQINEVRMDVYGLWTSMLVSLRDASVKLSTIPGIKVEGEPTIGVKVARRPWPEMSLYFDEKTMFLRKQSFRAPDGGVTKTKEHVFEDYKLFEGVYLPTKIRTVVGGVEIFRWEGLEYNFPTSFPKDTFEKPQPKK